MRQLQAAFKLGHAQTGENPELRAFFYRLAWLRGRTAHVVFVADGADRPSVKRGTQVRTTPLWLQRILEDFVVACGFAWIEAPGEAEAELAHMNKTGFVDVVLTDDSDVLVLGAPVVMRKYVFRSATSPKHWSSPCTPSSPVNYKRDCSDHVRVYRATDIESKADLTQGDMLLYALLVGNDYHDGLKGCGQAVALEIVKCGFGQILYEALLRYPDNNDHKLAVFLAGWRYRVKCALKAGSTNFKRKHPALAENITDAFPDLYVARLFLHPLVSPVERYEAIPGPRPMDLARLGHLCELHFSFGSSTGIKDTFRTALWPGELVSMLVAEGLVKLGHAIEPVSCSMCLAVRSS
ncbi:PIN domain-like protein [Epithele typhae]|uniref:PIN domain-like protein n=1 Tax=Epithele typhae TaxID=378194 RepID=UPI0020077BA0|nr:PIN domain-like protein [Epithele typhae]KAH9908813.1 PIN domain-like protein [Epithele typhae]